MISCPSCNWPTSSVKYTTDCARSIRRRRECLKCKGRFTTVEICRSDLPPGLDPVVGRQAPASHSVAQR